MCCSDLSDISLHLNKRGAAVDPSAVVRREEIVAAIRRNRTVNDAQMEELLAEVNRMIAAPDQPFDLKDL